MQGLARTPGDRFPNHGRVRRRAGVWVNRRSDARSSLAAGHRLATLKCGVRVWALMAAAGVWSRAAVAQSADLEPGRPAPTFDLARLEGGRVMLAEFRGHPVVINFWATWCTPCRVEMPMLIGAWQEHRGRALEIVAINLTDQERRKDVRQFVEQLKLPFYVALDERGRVRERYGLMSLPTTVFVDSAGTVRAVHAGPLSERNLADGLAAIVPSPTRAAPATGVDSTK